MKTKILFLSLLTILFSCQKTEIKVFGEQTSVVPIPKTINIDPEKRGLILSNSILFFTSSSENFSPRGGPPSGRLLKWRASSDGPLRGGLTVSKKHEILENTLPF